MAPVVHAERQCEISERVDKSVRGTASFYVYKGTLSIHAPVCVGVVRFACRHAALFVQACNRLCTSNR